MLAFASFCFACFLAVLLSCFAGWLCLACLLALRARLLFCLLAGMLAFCWSTCFACLFAVLLAGWVCWLVGCVTYLLGCLLAGWVACLLLLALFALLVHSSACLPVRLASCAVSSILVPRLLLYEYCRTAVNRDELRTQEIIRNPKTHQSGLWRPNRWAVRKECAHKGQLTARAKQRRGGVGRVSRSKLLQAAAAVSTAGLRHQTLVKRYQSTSQFPV